MRGIDQNTGKALEGIEHLRQSVRDILTTPIGTRVLLRDYGSQLFELIDAPLNRSTVMDIIAAVADALDRWEPRIALQSVKPFMPAPGQLFVDLGGIYLPTGEFITLDGIEVR
jgi:phage baseplate assembly protein W